MLLCFLYQVGGIEFERTFFRSSVRAFLVWVLLNCVIYIPLFQIHLSVDRLSNHSGPEVQVPLVGIKAPYLLEVATALEL
jgi:hypothetical protein